MTNHGRRYEEEKEHLIELIRTLNEMIKGNMEIRLEREENGSDMYNLKLYDNGEFKTTIKDGNFYKLTTYCEGYFHALSNQFGINKN